MRPSSGHLNMNATVTAITGLATRRSMAVVRMEGQSRSDESLRKQRHVLEDAFNETYTCPSQVLSCMRDFWLQLLMSIAMTSDASRDVLVRGIEYTINSAPLC